MKGVVFTQFMELVEEKFGFDAVDDMIEKAGVEGVYTQAGNYQAEELLALVTALSEVTGVEVNDLVFAYGEHLFAILITIYPEPIKMYNSTFEFISHVDHVVHPEVKKLYPDADLPEFETISCDENELKVIYKSTKPLMEFAKGLMVGCAKHYGETIEIFYEEATVVDGKFYATFTLSKK
jgi:hypothetical protein